MNKKEKLSKKSGCWEKFMDNQLIQHIQSANIRPCVLSSGDNAETIVLIGNRIAETVLPRLDCQILLVPGERERDFPQICAKTIVTYGLSQKDSITISSVSADELVLAIQREMRTLSGQKIEEQEIPLPLCAGKSLEDCLFLYAAFVLLDAKMFIPSFALPA